MPIQPTTLEAACLGKLPTHGDFVRHRASTPTMRAFDEWLRTGLHRVRQRRGRPWKQAFDDAPTIRFLFTERNREAPNALLGVLRPSRDRNGRTYPFCVTCELPTSSLHPDHLAYLPLQADPFYTTAEHIVQEATAGTLSYREVTDRVEQINPTLPLNSSAPTEYTRFTREQTLRSFLTSLPGLFEDHRTVRLFKNLLDVFLPLRDRPMPRLNYGLEFPLSEDLDLLSSVACFWLDGSFRLLDPPDTTCSFFWTPQVPDAASPFLLLFVGAPQAHAVFHRLTSEEASEDLFKVDHPERENEAPSLPKAYGSLLENEQRSLRDVLEQL